MNTPTTSFTQLFAWQEGHVLVLSIYQIVKTFPRDELFALTSQMRRAAISITSNIAEGYSRKSYKEKIQFYYMSLGSLTELQNQLYRAKDICYISPDEFVSILNQTIKVHKIITGLIIASKNRKYS